MTGSEDYLDLLPPLRRCTKFITYSGLFEYPVGRVTAFNFGRSCHFCVAATPDDMASLEVVLHCESRFFYEIPNLPSVIRH